MRLPHLISVAPFPPVIAASDIAVLRQNPDSEATRDFLGGYLGLDVRSQHALHTTLSSLRQVQNGGAFWINGVFGSGKSHLLGVLTLLAEGTGTEVFAATHPDCAHLLTPYTPKLAVHISLDEWEAARLGLEEIFWREVEREWKKRGCGDLQIERNGARAESFASLFEQLNAQNLAGLAVCFDELSLFLAGRNHADLQNDAAFLQFLGNHTRRAPLWVFAALQKTIEDISGLERYSLEQLRDRFTLLPLSLANITALVARRLVRVVDAENLQKTCDASFLSLAERLPRLDFGPREWRSAFPFHPATLSLLEAVTGRFFSRTRSAALFCTLALQTALSNDAEAEFRIAPDAIWDYFADELEAHPDLRPLLTVWSAWEDAIESIFPDKDRNNGRRLMKVVLLCKIAGQNPTPVQLANALDFPLEISGDGAYEYARFLLERIRARGAFLAIERGESPLFDRYSVDLGRRVGEMARRHIGAALENLPVGDERVAAHALSCCRGEFPLSELQTPRSFALFWLNAPRRLSVEVWDGHSPQGFANRVGATRENGAADDAVLAILPPFGRQQDDLDESFRLLSDEARPALWIWKPRPAARDEWDLARESAAAHLVSLDPMLLDNRRGRALLDHLQKEAPARETALSRLSLRLLLEGELILGDGAALEASELARGEGFTSLLEAVGDFAWPHLFPRFTAVAPRARLLTPSNADTLCLEILRRDPAEPFFAASLARLAQYVGEPLGVAQNSAGRWKIAAGKPELIAAFKEFIGEGVLFSSLEAHFAKSAWGLRPEQTTILTCALLRSGDIAAFDTRDALLSPTQIGLPLRRSVYFLRPGLLLDAPSWAKIAVLMRELCGTAVGANSFAESQKVADALLEWRENTAQGAELARARAAQLRRVLGHDEWPRFERASAALGALLESVPLLGAAFEILSRASSLDMAMWREEIAQFARTEAAMEERTAPLLALHGLLTHPDFVTPPDLALARDTLFERLSAGEAAIFDAELQDMGADLTADYGAQYALWHYAQNDPARWNSWRKLAQSNELRALERLNTLQNRAFGDGTRTQIEVQIAKRCARDGALSAGEAVCSSCGLRWNERLMLDEPRPIETALRTGLGAFRHALEEGAVRASIQGHNSPLLEWDGELTTLLPLLSNAQLQLLDEAFAPRRRVRRDGAVLLQDLKECRTRRDMEAAFARWLDGGENLGGEDEIEVQ